MKTRSILRFMLLGTLAVLLPLQASAQTTAPEITAQPISLTVAAGANAAFLVTASGTAPLSYQWFKGDTAITTATSASLVLSAVTAADAGSYTVKVSNAAGTVTSAAATLTVAPAGTTPPTITTQPASQTVAAGANATFMVVAIGTAPLTYQWSKGGTAISGGTTASLTLNAVATTDAGSYTVTVTNAAGSVTSAAATLTVMPVVVGAPTIVTQPASQTVAAGASASFTVVAAGALPLTYQWSKGGTAISGATSATFTISAVAAADAGSYTVKVSNSAGDVTSAAATLTVTPVASAAPVITAQPTSQSVAAGASATFSVTATGSGTLMYSWFKEGRLVSLGSNATLTITATTSADAGAYRVVVSNASGSTISNVATLTVTGIVTPPPVVGTAPTITTQPASLIVSAGAKATFTVVASGTAPLRYRWFKNGHDLDSDSSGSATFTISSAQIESAAVYTVKVSNSAGSVTSAPATLGVNVVANTITTAPASADVKAGADAKFTVTAAGTGLTYQWKFNGRPIKGATDTTLTLTNVGTTTDGAYTVVISNSTGPIAAAAAALTVSVDARLINIATRGHVGEDDEVLISGFVTRGDGQKKILLRAVGPTLGTAFSVTGVLANPKLTLFHGSSVVDTNSGWGGATALVTAFAQVGAFPLPPTSADAALFETLSSGAYTAMVTAPSGKSGVALVEAYDADTGSPPAEIVNISTRALVGAEAANTLIAGFAVSGTTSDTVLIRGVGSSLGTLFGMRRALGASHVAVFDSKGNQIAANTVWAAGRDDRDDDEDDTMNDMDDACDRAGAWRLPHGSNDSALILTLAPGVYTAHVTGVRNSSGIGLVEIFEVH